MLAVVELVLNLFVMFLIAAPLFVIEIKWGMEKHWVASTVVWFVTLAAVHTWVLPWLGLEMNRTILQCLP